VIDLHVHTCYSDGEHTPCEIIELAKKHNLDTIAITDHDRVGGVKEAIEEGNKVGIYVIPGIEVTAFDEVEVHVLGYNIDVDSPELLSYIETVKTKQEKEISEIFCYLNSIDIKLEKDDVYKFRDGEFVTMWHFAKAIAEKGYALDVRDAIDRFFLKTSLKERKNDRISVKDAINIIKASDGVPVLAHPVRLELSFDRIIEKIIKWKEYGLAGLEAIYSLNSEVDTKRYLKLAEDYELTVTMGSDYHGEHVKPNIKMGEKINGVLTRMTLIDLNSNNDKVRIEN